MMSYPIDDDLRARLSDALAKVNAEKPIIDALKELPGIGQKRAEDIVKAYGGRAIEVVRDTPYALIHRGDGRGVRGIGFTIADTIALMNGLPSDSEARINAGIEHCIDSICQATGHCYVDRPSLLQEAVKLLGVDKSLASSGLDRLIAMRLVVDEEGALFAAHIHTMETAVSRKLADIKSTSARVSAAASGLFARSLRSLPESAEEAISRFPHTLSESQAEAVRAIADEKALVITGGPGTGKTTVLKVICDTLRLAGLSFSLAAPTGRAAKRMIESTGCHAQTLHKLLGIKPGKAPDFSATRPLRSDVIVIDETSMVGLDMMVKLIDAIDPRSRLVIIGDVDQLPSISPGAVLRDVIASGVVRTVRLSQVFRQAKGSTININAQRINAGEKPVSEKQSPTGEFFILPETSDRCGEDRTVSFILRAVPSIFGLDPVKDAQVLCPSRAAVASINARLKEALNPAAGRPSFGGFHVGDKVINTRNDYKRDVINGDVGFVSAVKSDRSGTPVSLAVSFDDDKVVEYGKEDVGDLGLAYALTIHKSQGGEYKAVVVLMIGPQRMLSRNLLYTAVTRGKKVVAVVSNDDVIGKALCETRLGVRNTRLAQRLALCAA